MDADVAVVEIVDGGWHATSLSNSIDDEICAMQAVMVAMTSSSRK